MGFFLKSQNFKSYSLKCILIKILDAVLNIVFHTGCGTLVIYLLFHASENSIV